MISIKSVSTQNTQTERISQTKTNTGADKYQSTIPENRADKIGGGKMELIAQFYFKHDMRKLIKYWANAVK
jgi:hypothetical protein